MNSLIPSKYTTFVLVIFFSCSIVLFEGGCKKEEENPSAPVITFKNISSSNVEQFNNNITVTFEYEDWQGDLGEMDPDDYSLSVKDSRLPEADWFHIPPMTPDMQQLHIKGTYQVTLTPLFLLGNGSQETTELTVQITDRAGNLSNQITTPEVLIVDSL